MADGAGCRFDLIVVTAGNEAQAAGYRAMLRHLSDTMERFARNTLVVSDPKGGHVGSLGSTYRVLRRIGSVAGRRVLICHSGGESSRLPAYSAIGKAFVPVPDGEGGTCYLLERIVGNMERLSLPCGGVLVVSGDVAPQFDFGAASFDRPGATGVAFPASTAEGALHGVYVPGPDGTVAAFLQKPTPDEAKAAGALLPDGREFVDTGILWLDAATADRLAASRECRAGDIYREFPAMLLKGFAPFNVCTVPNCDFFNIGTSADLLDILGDGREWVEGCGIPRNRMKLAGRNIVTFVPESYGTVELGEGECLTCFHSRGRWIPVKYRVEDDLKANGDWKRRRIGLNARLCDRGKLLALRGIRPTSDVRLPLRIDLAGGWSDTPPICNDLGGAVFNLAVELEGQKPVRAYVRRLSGIHEVRVESEDLGKSCTLTRASQFEWPYEAGEWCALVKSALKTLRYSFDGDGLELLISAAVPKGCGLGTSSILCAALTMAYEDVFGRNPSWKEISATVLEIERQMRTCGGWQDQIGGLLPGAKLVETRPGRRQDPKVRTLPPEAAERFDAFLRERGMLYFTGHTRMARNILFGVLHHYEEQLVAARKTVRRMKRDARRAFAAAESGDWNVLCESVNACWEAKKWLDPGSTNPQVESIMERLAPYVSAATLCGAGGGGFLFAIAKSAESKEAAIKDLEAAPPFPEGRFYSFRLAK